ncbi:MAG: GGDEF domain-containing protein [Lachnospiraceae bacterium]|nr:GGDEF domain-containing protein [Lachnospiraceae bacterium]
MKRKKIALLTISPDDETTTYIMNRVFSQCNAYGYDVVVVSPMVHSSHFFKDYLEGELRIYDIINFDLFDGVLITPIPMQEEQNTELVDRLLEKFKKECHVPVVALDSPFGDYDVVYSNEESGIKTIATHIIKKHGCRNIAILTGPKQVGDAENRLEILRKCLKDNGIVIDDSRIVYGDFWYLSGEKLAMDIVSGAFDRPEAIICTSDHMAIGLTNALINCGIGVPEDIKVIGYGGTMEAAMNYTPVTTYEYDRGYNGAAAVNRLVRMIEPDRELIEAKIAGDENICYGVTCGCMENSTKIRRKLREYLRSSDYESNEEAHQQGVSMSALSNSYISESFTSMESVDACLKKIYESVYLLKPYTCFYMCLNTDWLEANRGSNKYTKHMNMVIYSDMDKKLHGYENHVFWGTNGVMQFDISKMLPIFDNELARCIPGLEDISLEDDIFDKPQVYYFTPLHYGNVSMGYAVLQNDLTEPARLNPIYGTYIRYLNNALEMSRAKNLILKMSEHDQMTGLYNRRGLERAFMDWRQDALSVLKNHPDKEYNVVALVIDMNNLKLLNDTKGHEAGDEGINAIAKAIQMTVMGREISARCGGDEFYVLGIGRYREEDASDMARAFKDNLIKVNQAMGGQYEYSAAIGYAIMPLIQCDDYHMVIDEADVMMYVDKKASKKGRSV